jgi:hypothetical protein
VENAEFYQAEGADELAMLDIAATLKTVKHDLDGGKMFRMIRIPLRRRRMLRWRISTGVGCGAARFREQRGGKKSECIRQARKNSQEKLQWRLTRKETLDAVRF